MDHNCDMETFGDRLRLARKEAGFSQIYLAKKAGLSQTTISDIERGRNAGSTEAPLLASILNVSALWLAEGSGSMRGLIQQAMHAGRTAPDSDRYIDDAEAAGFVPVRRVAIRLSAGVSGYSVEQDESESTPIFFRADWLKTKGWRATDLIAVRITGESMQPNLFDGDLVVVNTSETQPRDGDVFAANYEGELVIKRMRKESGDWWLDSDNADQARHKPKRCGDGCHLIGRVVYKQSERI